jgi:diguanylate cyclase (GGDEF)-like protein
VSAITALIGLSIAAYFLVLGSHALRRRLGLAPFHAVLGAFSVVVSIVTDTGMVIQAGGASFLVGSVVFFTAILLGAFALYICDGPKAMRQVLLIVFFVSLAVHLTSQGLQYLITQDGITWTGPFISNSTRVVFAGLTAMLCDLLFLTIMWEYLANHTAWLPFIVRLWLTLLGVLWLDSLLFLSIGLMGTPYYLPMLKGCLFNRLLVALFASPWLWFYLRWQSIRFGYKEGPRPVLGMLHEMAGAISNLWESRAELDRRFWARRELQKQQSKLSLAVQASGAGVMEHNISPDKFMRVDQRYAEILGFTLDELPPKDHLYQWWLQRLHPKDRPRITRAYEGFVHGLEPDFNQEYRLRHKDGTYRNLHGMARSLSRDSDGMAISTAGLILDITQRRKWEDYLEESQRRLAQIVDFLPDATLVIDRESKVIAWNRAMEFLTGVPASEILGKGGYEYALPFYGYKRPLLVDIAIDPELGLGLDYAFIRRDRFGGVSSETYHPHMGKKGVYLWGLGRPLFDAKNQLVGGIQSIRDITERKKSERDREELISRLRTAQENLRRLSLLDSLTGLANRRHFDEAIMLELRRANRQGQPLGLIMADIDHFKEYNDTYGHQAGDRCLKQISKTLKCSLKRPGDLAGRFGGEEFVVLLPNTGTIGTMRVARKLKLAVEALNITHQESPVDSKVTLSLGVANTMTIKVDDPGHLVSAADRAMYLAKEKGRNRIVEAKAPADATRMKQVV